MKKNIIIIILMLIANISDSQDIIGFNDGTLLKVKVIEVNSVAIKYKNENNLDGPDFIIEKSKIQFIKYKNGLKDTFNTIENKPERASPVENTTSPENDRIIDKINRKGESSISLDIGVLTLNDFDKKYDWSGLEIGVSYLFSLSKAVNLGFETFFSSLTSKTLIGKNDNASTNYLYNYNYKINALTLYAKSQFFWLNRTHIGLYSGLDVGFVAGSVTSNLVYAYGRPDQYDLNPAAIQLTFVGIKYFGRKHWYGNYELGFGKRGILNVGIGYRL